MIKNPSWSKLSAVNLGTEESGRREVTVIDGFKQESMYGMSAKKGAVVEGFKQESVHGLCAKRVAVVKRWPWLLVEV